MIPAPCHALLEHVHVQASPATSGDTAETANGERPPSVLINDAFAASPADTGVGGGGIELQVMPEYDNFTDGVLTSARVCVCVRARVRVRVTACMCMLARMGTRICMIEGCVCVCLHTFVLQDDTAKRCGAVCCALLGLPSWQS